MIKAEAIVLMKQGKKLRHRHFGQEEWVTMGEDGRMILEDGVKCTPYEFWMYRYGEEWEKDWELFIEQIKENQNDNTKSE